MPIKPGHFTAHRGRPYGTVSILALYLALLFSNNLKHHADAHHGDGHEHDLECFLSGLFADPGTPDHHPDEPGDQDKSKGRDTRDETNFLHLAGASLLLAPVVLTIPTDLGLVRMHSAAPVIQRIPTRPTGTPGDPRGPPSLPLSA